jgi:FkbM family methyltransferase
MVFDFIELLNKYNINVTGVIHAGGHFGSTIPMYQSANVSNVIYFESQKHAFEVLQQNLATTQSYKAYNFGLGPDFAEVTMYTEQANQGQSSSILEPKKVKDIYPHIPFVGIEAIKIVPLDSLGIQSCNFLTLDVQGYELEVFKGATNMLENYLKYLVCEVTFSELYSTNAKIYELDSYLLKYDFIRMDTFIHNEMESGDAFYIKLDELKKF